MINKLIKLANHLDSLGLSSEANSVDIMIRLASRTQEDIDWLQEDPEEWVNLLTGDTMRQEIDNKERYDELLKQLEDRGLLEGFLSYIDEKTELSAKLPMAEEKLAGFPWSPKYDYYSESDDVRDCMSEKLKKAESDVLASSGGLSALDTDVIIEMLGQFKEECESELEA
jgi:hypothetical protein|tara:strand:- start:31706 stop:32215 length:510 start_codon:yes stop_codon:yes gene_type:complete